MVSLLSEPCVSVTQKICDYDKNELVSVISGMLTVPEYSANTLRIEVALHLALSSSDGKKSTNRTILNTIFNDVLSGTDICYQEDPQEDVFVSNIYTCFGDYRIFNSLWEANDFFTQCLVDIMTDEDLPVELNAIFNSCLSLLKVSEFVAEKSGVVRNEVKESYDKQKINIPGGSWCRNLSKRTIIPNECLASIGVCEQDLDPFVLPKSEYKKLRKEEIGNSILERKPVVRVGDNYCLALPGAVGVAIRYAFLESCNEFGLLDTLSKTLQKYQFNRMYKEFLFGVRRSLEVLDFSGIDSDLPMSSILFHDKHGEFFCSIIMHENLSELLNEGIGSVNVYDEKDESSLDEYIGNILDKCKENSSFRSLNIMISNGGLGRGILLTSDSSSSEVKVCHISLSDLYLLSSKGEGSLKEFMLCMEQKEWLKDQGVSIKNINGDVNYYGFWLNNDRRCVPFDTSIDDGLIMTLYTDYVLPVRVDFRHSSDRHSVRYTNDSHYIVSRLETDSLFSNNKDKPIYACVEHISNGFLNGVVESELTDVWFGLSEYPKGIGSKIAYDWWSGFISLIERGLSLLNKNDFESGFEIIQVLFNMGKVDSSSDVSPSAELGFTKSIGDKCITYEFNKDYLGTFKTADNFAERTILHDVLYTVTNDFLVPIDGVYSVDDIVQEVLVNNDVKIIHVFYGDDEVDYFLHSVSGNYPYLINKDLISFECFKVFYQEDNAFGFCSGKAKCGAIFNKAVDSIWKEIRTLLSEVDCVDLVYKLTSILNDLDQDAKQWFRTSKAVYALNGENQSVVEVAQTRNSDRSLTSVCARSLIEMAICECPVGKGNKISQSKLERLLALCGVLINVASDADAVHWGLVEPQLYIAKDGSYSIDTDVGSKVINPYMMGHFSDQFMSSIDDYEKLYEPNQSTGEEPRNYFSSEFDEAFKHEFKISANQTMLCFSELVSAHLAQKKATLILTHKEIISILVDSGVDKNIAENFVNSFSLCSREKWDDFGSQYSFRDIAPWKHKRRLSCLAKPLLLLKDGNVCSSLILIVKGFIYFLEKSYSGEFSTDFFSTSEMRNYVAKKYNERGSDFTETVGAKFTGGGWEIKKELLMKSLGAPIELGDVDVLAIRDNKAYVVECKNLQMAKTISEIADVCNRFLGLEKDELRKHLNRVDWIVENKDLVSKYVKSDICEVKGILVTNTNVPMKYKSDLAIDSDNILSLNDLDKGTID